MGAEPINKGCEWTPSEWLEVVFPLPPELLTTRVSVINVEPTYINTF